MANGSIRARHVSSVVVARLVFILSAAIVGVFSVLELVVTHRGRCRIADSTRWLGRSARIGVGYGLGELGTAADDTTLQLFQTLVDLCPVGWGVASLCSGLEAGALVVQSGAALGNDTTGRFFLAGRAGAQLRWAWDEAWLGALDGGWVLPITLDEFVVERADGGERSLHHVTPSGFVTLAIAYRF